MVGEPQGSDFSGGKTATQGGGTLRGVNPATRETLEPPFHEATGTDINRALDLAAHAFKTYRTSSGESRADFLEAIAVQLEAGAHAIVNRAALETGLTPTRLEGELARTTRQLRMFAELVRAGSWVGARIDHDHAAAGQPPQPDLRRMLIPLGPVVVFSASNFPLAFSVAGGDTASALAAGCSVVVKAHPAHPGTSELVAAALLAAVERTGMPSGVFSLLHGVGHEVGLALVRHPATKAVGFTGSLIGGRALFDAAAARPEPIPVYAEMGSTNPVFVLPRALAERSSEIAAGLVNSMTLAVGQFCTSPGLVVLERSSDAEAFVAELADALAVAEPGVMLYSGIHEAFERDTTRLSEIKGVERLAQGERRSFRASPQMFVTNATTFLTIPLLAQEIFGPSTLIVYCENIGDAKAVADSLAGHLTATLHANEAELETCVDLIESLTARVGRLIFNGFPTGVAVSPAMQHGGPYPATTAPATTSVGTAAIERFVRPIAYQDFPQAALPPELRDRNPLRIWRLVNGSLTRNSDQQ